MVKIINTQKQKLIKSLLAGSFKGKNNIFAKFLLNYKNMQKKKLDNCELLNSRRFKSIPACKASSNHKMQQLKLILETNKRNLQRTHKNLRVYYGKNSRVKVNPIVKSKKHFSRNYQLFNSKKRTNNFKKSHSSNCDRRMLLLVLKECNLAFNALAAQIGKYSTTSACPLRLTQKTSLIFQQLLSFIEYMTLTDMQKEKSLIAKEKIRTKRLIENTCICLDAIAELNQNKFLFRNLDAIIIFNPILLSRLVLNICYYILAHCERQSIIEVLSYIEENRLVIEFLTMCKPPVNNLFSSRTWQTLLKGLDSRFCCEVMSEHETAFKLSLPYENIRF